MRKIWQAFLPTWADRNLKVILAARVWMSGARAMAAVVTAIYLAAIGFPSLEISTLFVGVTLASALMSAAIGLLADRRGRKPFLVAVPLIAAGAGVVFAETHISTLLFVAAALGTFGTGQGAGGGNVGPYQPAEVALVADGLAGNQRAVAFSRIYFASTLGSLIGGLLAVVVHTTPHMSAADATAAYRPAFLLAAAMAAVAGLLALLLQEPPRPTERDGAPRRKFRWPRRSWPALWRFSVTNTALGTSLGLFASFVSYWLNRRYGAAPGTIGVLFAIVSLATLVATLGAAPVGRFFGTVRALAVTRALAGVMLVPMVLAPTFWLAGAFYLVRMMLQRVGMPLLPSFTQDMADPEERASLAALSNVPMQTTMAGGQVMAGYLFTEIGLAAPFELSAVLQVTTAVCYLLFFSVRPPAKIRAADAVEAEDPV